MTDKCRAIVQEGPRRLSRQEFPLPETGPEDALLRVEACGICGSDYEQYAGALPAPFPVIPGHEPVGIIEELGEGAGRRRGGGGVVLCAGVGKRGGEGGAGEPFRRPPRHQRGGGGRCRPRPRDHGRRDGGRGGGRDVLRRGGGGFGGRPGAAGGGGGG